MLSKVGVVAATMLGVLVGGCAMRAPYINSLYTASTPMVSLPDTAVVEIFLKESPPKREFEVLGTIDIATDNESRTVENMVSYAKAEVRKMGGEALVNVEFGSQTTEGSSTPVRNLYTGQVMFYSHEPGLHRSLRGLAVRWKP